MSAQELDRLTVIERVIEKRLSQAEAGKQLGVTTRQMRRLIERYRRDGAAGLVSKKRGMQSNRSYPDAVKNAVIALVRQRYHDFGPTLITEKLDEKHDIQLSHRRYVDGSVKPGFGRIAGNVANAYISPATAGRASAN